MSTKVIIKDSRLSFVHAFHPATPLSGNPDDAKYSVSIIIPKDSPQIPEIRNAIKEATEEGRSAKFGGKIPANLRTCLRDGDTDRPEDPAYANSYFINASSKNAPGILEPTKQRMTDETHLYSGCYAHVAVNFYAYNAAGNKGVTAGLNNIMKTRDGEPLSGAASAEADFAGFDSVVPSVSDDDWE